MTISSKKLKEIREHYLTKGSDRSPEHVIEAFGLSGTEELEAYQEGLRVKFPDDFPEDESPEPEFTYFVKQDGNLLQELELVKNKGKVLIFAVKEPKDLVTILLKGKPVEVDLYQLRKLPPTSTEHGLPVSRLIELAEIARA